MLFAASPRNDRLRFLRENSHHGVGDVCGQYFRWRHHMDRSYEAFPPQRWVGARLRNNDCAVLARVFPVRHVRLPPELVSNQTTGKGAVKST